ncbi:hypothetical protein O9993_02325 [Vibrio lentus]|nr:hypothetical protein [Vibrio lentus]
MNPQGAATTARRLRPSSPGSLYDQFFYFASLPIKPDNHRAVVPQSSCQA